MCERQKKGGKHVCKLLASNRNVFADCFYAVHTHQLEFANTSLPTLVCRVKAALLRMIFASLARAHLRLCVQNIRDFPQAELNREINARFLLNKQGDPHFLLHEFKLHRAIYHFSRLEEKFEILLQNS